MAAVDVAERVRVPVAAGVHVLDPAPGVPGGHEEVAGRPRARRPRTRLCGNGASPRGRATPLRRRGEDGAGRSGAAGRPVRPRRATRPPPATTWSRRGPGMPAARPGCVIAAGRRQLGSRPRACPPRRTSAANSINRNEDPSVGGLVVTETTRRECVGRSGANTTPAAACRLRQSRVRTCRAVRRVPLSVPMSHHQPRARSAGGGTQGEFDARSSRGGRPHGRRTGSPVPDSR